MRIVCLSTLESVSPSLSALLNAISALALCQNMLENISHLNQDHQRTEIHCFESWIPSPWNVKHATRLIMHEYFVQRQRSSECRWTKTSDRSGNLKAIKYNQVISFWSWLAAWKRQQMWKVPSISNLNLSATRISNSSTRKNKPIRIHALTSSLENG